MKSIQQKTNGSLGVTWALSMLVLVGVAMRSYGLTLRSLWFDEAFSWRLVQFPFQEMISRAATDVHPVAYYVILKIWSVVFGTSVLALRSFSVTMAACSVIALYGFVSYAFTSKKAGMIAAALFAVSGWQIAFAWEARMYTLGVLMAILSAWALLYAVRQTSQKIWPWMVYAITAIILLHTHYYGLFTMFAQVVFIGGMVLVESKARVGEIVQAKMTWFALLAGVVIMLGVAPWVPTFLAQNAQVQDQYWIPPLNKWSVADTLYRMMLPTAGAPVHTGFGAIGTITPLVAVLLGAIVLIAIARRRKDTKASMGKPAIAYDAVLLTLLLMIAPFILSIVLSLGGQSLYNDRFFVFAHMFILVEVAVIVAAIPSLGIRRTMVAVICAGSLLSTARYWSELDIPNKPGARAVTQYIIEQRETNAPVLVSSSFIYFSILYYMQEMYSSDLPTKLYSESKEFSHFAGGPIITSEDIVDSGIWQEEASTVWVVDTTGFGSSALVPPSMYSLQEEKIYPEVFPHQGEVIARKYQKR